MNFSTLFKSSAEKLAAFRKAKDFYDLRSAIAHGNKLPEKVKVGEKELNFSEAAKEARTMLRYIIKHFLLVEKRAQYRQSGYWENAYFQIAQ